MGGKAKLAKQIAQYLKTLRKPGQLYIEPFVGAANVMCEMNDGTGPCRAFDAHPDLILMWQAVQRGWKPPGEASRELYRRLRRARPSALRAFVGFGCSYAAKFFAGYAYCERGSNYAGDSRRGVLSKASRLESVIFERKEFSELRGPVGALIYCDPPYLGAETFPGVPSFNHSEFWCRVRRWSKRNTVIVSESVAPLDFVPVLELNPSTGLRKLGGSLSRRREFLFQHESQAGGSI